MSVVRTNASTDELFLTLNGKLSTIFFLMKLQKYFKLFIHVCLACCGTVALVVLGKLANIRKLAKDHSYGSAANVCPDMIMHQCK